MLCTTDFPLMATVDARSFGQALSILGQAILFTVLPERTKT